MTDASRPPPEPSPERGVAAGYCANCGAPLLPEARFCTKCGTPRPGAAPAGPAA
ncbi:MAG: zinc-ribbon domain-containing protein, partial [Acidimicrobiales bacterium]